MIVTKRELASELTLKGYLPYRVARILGTSVGQVARLVSTEDTWTSKPRKK